MNKMFAVLMCSAALAILASCGKSKKPETELPKTPPVDLHAVTTPDAPVLHAAKGVGATGRSPRLVVGNHTFSKNDVALREKVIRYKYGSVPDITVKALAQLINGFLLVSVLESMGKPITYKILQEEFDRIDRSTQAPDDLKKIKEIFGGGGEISPSGDGSHDTGLKYALIFVLPDFANRKYFFDVFPKEKALQKTRLDRAHQTLRALTSQDSPDFQKTARSDKGWKRDEVLFRASRGFYPKPRPGETKPPRPEPKDPGILPGVKPGRWREMDKELFSKTAKGRACNQVVELETAFLILRWTGWHDEKKKVRTVERLILEKLSPHEYFEKRISKIGVEIADPDLRKDFKKKISWAGNIHWVR